MTKQMIQTTKNLKMIKQIMRTTDGKSAKNSEEY